VPPYVPASNPAQPLPPPSFNNCQPDAASHVAPNYPVRIYLVDKRTEVFTLQNVSTQAVDLTGWMICSIQGNEQFSGMSVTIAPEEMRSFVYPGAAIWNNNELDDAALYNAQGQLVSYWSDPNWQQ
jgi:hypothetical protein